MRSAALGNLPSYLPPTGRMSCGPGSVLPVRSRHTNSVKSENDEECIFHAIPKAMSRTSTIFFVGLSCLVSTRLSLKSSAENAAASELSEKSPCMESYSSCTAILPTRGIMLLFLKGLYMPRGRKTSLMIRLTLIERQTLLAWQRATTTPAGLARRARILLLLANGATITDIAATVGVSRRFVYKWAKRFLQEGLEGLEDKPGRGRRLRLRPLPPSLREQHDMDMG